MTDSDRRQIKMLWDNRVPINNILKMLPYKKVVIREMISELRKDGTLKERHCKQTAIKAVGDMFESGVTNIEELCEIFNYSPNTILNYISLAKGNEGRPPHNYRKKSLNEKTKSILRELNEGKGTLSEIARKYGVSRQYVHQLKKEIKENQNV